MNIKRYFPIIAILLFTCLISLGTTSHLFFITKYPEDPAVQIVAAGKDAVTVRSDDGNHYH